MASWAVGIIGCGNMGTAMIEGMRRSPSIGELRLKHRHRAHAEKLAQMEAPVPATVVDDHPTLCRALDLLLVAVKPKDVAHVCEEVAEHLEPNTLVVSCAAGLNLARLAASLPANQPLARIMPNTAARFGRSVTAACVSREIKESSFDGLRDVVQAFGKMLMLPNEDLMHPATALAGSGPAFFLLLLDAMTRSGVEAGLEPETARELAQGGLEGAAVLAEDKGRTLEELRVEITSPGGTTQAGLETMMAKNMERAIEDTVAACMARSRAMATE